MSSTRFLLLAILLLALGVRIAYVLTNERNPLGEGPRDADIAHNLLDEGKWFYLNERAMIYMDNSVAAHHELIDPSSFDFSSLNKGATIFPETAEPIGSAAVLAAVWGIVGSERYLPMQLLQAIVDAFGSLLVYRISMLLFNRRRAAILAAALYALYFPIAWQTIVVYNDIWAVDFTLVVVAACLETWRSPTHRWRWLVACGVLTGVGAYFRPTVLILPLVIALAAIPQTGWRVALHRGLTITAIAALLLVPWTIRNYEDFHAFIPTRTTFWENMWYGLGEKHNNFGASEDVYNKLRPEVARVRPDLRYESPAWESFIKPRVESALENHALYYLGLLPHRVAVATALVYEPEWMRRGVSSPASYPGGPLAFSGFIITRPLQLLEILFQPLIFLFSMLTIAMTRRRFKREHAILIAIALCCLVPFIVIRVTPRYILPVAFTYCLWLGLGADLLLRHRLPLRLRPARSPSHSHQG